MLAPGIAQRQAEIEKRKKKTPTPTPAFSPTPVPVPKPAAVQKLSAAKSYTQPAAYTEPKTYTAPTPAATSAAKQAVNKTFGGYSSPASNAAKGTVANTLAKAETMAESIYKPNSQLANNQYTTAAQRRQQNKARENYISQMQQKKPKEYGGWSNHSYGGVTKGTQQYDKDLNTLWNKYGAQLTGRDTKPKSTGPNAEMAKAAVTAKKETPFLEKVENQSVNYAKRGWNLFDWMDDFSNNKGPNSEADDSVKIKASEKTDLTAGAQGNKPQKPVDMFVSKDGVRQAHIPTERQKLFNEMLEAYGEIGRKGVEERHSLAPDASVYDTSEEIQHITELENQLDMLDRAEKTGLYDEDMTLPDRFVNTAKEWGNRALHSIDYIAQTAGTALTDYAESQLNKGYNNAIKNRQNIIIQLNRIGFGLDEDPYGKNEARLLKQLENINRYIDENYSEKMDTTTNAYRAMERAEKYEDKAVEGLSSGWAGIYNFTKDIIETAATLPMNMVVPGATLAIGTTDNAAQKMHEVNSYGGTAADAFWQGATAAGIDIAAQKMPAEDVIHILSGDTKYTVVKDVLEKYGAPVSKEVIDYVAKYMADEVYNNPYAEFDIEELLGKVLKTAIMIDVENGVAKGFI